jgi:hypothetical protein
MFAHLQILKDHTGNNIGVFLPMPDYESILDKLEEMEDIRDFDAAKLEKEEIIPLKDAQNKNTFHTF